MLAVQEVGTEVLTGDYLSQWLRHCRGRLRSKTHEGYEGLIRLYALPALGPIPLHRLHPLDPSATVTGPRGRHTARR